MDLGIVAASKVNLKEASDAGEFRDGLYYRLNVVTIEIPPLRDRREVLPPNSVRYVPC
ncbi:MAG: sigma 54-interacting transcriptional regulator [Sedimenticolaceae bacterium]|uniref:sigma 54-interacting transcriptional regulator n=1 Tax=Candidatus Vondammii sp. HM_W22 TaxID=2687299 RepID=UPI002A4E195E|nr:sigma 54-interacting transcriptional regulator [Candidatus Vondammii sp. HM_W22]